MELLDPGSVGMLVRMWDLQWGSKSVSLLVTTGIDEVVRRKRSNDGQEDAMICMLDFVKVVHNGKKMYDGENEAELY